MEALRDLEEIEDLVEGRDQVETEDLEEGLDQEETEGPEADLDLEVLVALEAGEVLEDPEDWAAKDKARAVAGGEEGMAVLQVLVAGTVSEAVEGTQILIQGAENKAQGLAALSLLLVVLFRCFIHLLFTYSMFFQDILIMNGPGVAEAVLQKPLSFIN